MNADRQVTVLAAVAGLLTLALGLLTSFGDADHGQLLSEQIELSVESLDLLLTERLSPVVPQDPELILAKQEEVIRPAEERIAALLEQMKRRDRSILGLTMALLLFQLVIILVEVSRSQPERALIWLKRSLLTLGTVLGAMSLFGLLWF